MRRNINNQSHWNRRWLEEGKDTWRQYPANFKRILELIKPNKNLIDLGCGNGVFLNKVKQNRKNMELMGLDISTIAINQLKEFYDIDGMVATLPDIPYPIENNNFDYVVMLEVIEHIDDERELMNNTFRILKPGGKLMVIVPENHTKVYKKFILKESSEHIKWFDEERLRQTLTIHGKNPHIEIINDENIRNGKSYKGKYYLGVVEK